MALTDESGNGGMVMPVAPMGNYGGGGFGGDWGSWIILFLIFGMFNGGWGNGFGGGAYGMMNYDFPWLFNGQQNVLNGVNANTNAGFQNAALTSAIGDLHNSVTSGFGDVQTALCGDFAGVNASINGAQNAISQQLYTNQIADLERSFNAQTANTQGLSALQSQLAQCCCDNRLATCQTQNIVQNEGNATRFADANNTRDLLTALNGGFQSIKDQLCDYRNEQKDDTIAQLRSELIYARGQASQVAQTADLKSSQAITANQLVSELRSCPIPSQPVYGNQPIFTCNGNSGCGCNDGAFYN